MPVMNGGILTRRRFLQGTLGAAGAVALNRRSAGQPSSGSRPNLLVLITDDQRWDALGCAGNTIIQTPHLDRLAAAGTRFSHAFCTTAICCASRASLLTGMYTRTHGVDNFSTMLPPAIFRQSYPLLLREHGYHTGFVGKWGVGGDLPADAFDVFHGFPGQGHYFNTVNGETVHMTRMLGDQSIDFLRQAPESQPFCLSVSFKAPHVQDEDPRQFLYDPMYECLYDDIEIPLAPSATEEDFLRQPEFVQRSEGRVRWGMRFSSPAQTQASLKGYYRLVTGIDDAVGRILQTLHERGLAENTVVVFTSDNGFFLGEHGLAGKWLMHEESIRIPFLVYDPRIPAGNRAKV